MSIHTDELRTRRLEALITPSELAHAFPLSDTVAQNLLDARREVEAILAGEDQRLLVIVYLRRAGYLADVVMPVDWVIAPAAPPLAPPPDEAAR